MINNVVDKKKLTELKVQMFSNDPIFPSKKELHYLLKQLILGIAICIMLSIVLFPFFVWSYRGMRILFFVGGDAYYLLQYLRFLIVLVLGRLALNQLDYRVAVGLKGKLQSNHFRLLLFFFIVIMICFTIILTIYYDNKNLYYFLVEHVIKRGLVQYVELRDLSLIRLFFYEMFVTPESWAAFLCFFWLALLPHDIRLLKMHRKCNRPD